MTEQQREHATKVLEEYQKEVDNLYYKINRNGIFTFIGFGFVIVIFLMDEAITKNKIVDDLIGVTNGASIIVNGLSAVKRIVRREALSQRIREIEYDLAMDSLFVDNPKVYQKKNNKNNVL